MFVKVSISYFKKRLSSKFEGQSNLQWKEKKKERERRKIARRVSCLSLKPQASFSHMTHTIMCFGSFYPAWEVS